MVTQDYNAAKIGWKWFLSRNADLNKISTTNRNLLEKILSTCDDNEKTAVYVKLSSKGVISECSKDTKGAIKIDLTDGLSIDEAKSLGIRLDRPINNIAAHGWVKPGSRDEQVAGSAAETIDNEEIQMFDLAVKSYMKATGFSLGEALAAYYDEKTGFENKDLKAMAENREASETSMLSSTSTSTGNHDFVVKVMASLELTKETNPIIVNLEKHLIGKDVRNEDARKEAVSFVLKNASGSGWGKDFQKTVLKLENAIKTPYSGDMKLQSIVTWAPTVQGYEEPKAVAVIEPKPKVEPAPVRPEIAKPEPEKKPEPAKTEVRPNPVGEPKTVETPKPVAVTPEMEKNSLVGILSRAPGLIGQKKYDEALILLGPVKETPAAKVFIKIINTAKQNAVDAEQARVDAQRKTEAANKAVVDKKIADAANAKQKQINEDVANAEEILRNSETNTDNTDEVVIRETGKAIVLLDKYSDADLGDRKDKVDSLRKALNYRLYLTRAIDFKKNGKFNEVLAEYDQILAILDPKTDKEKIAYFHTLKGEIYSGKINNFPEAIKEFKLAIGLSEKYQLKVVSSLSIAGIYKTKLKDFSNALDGFKLTSRLVIDALDHGETLQTLDPEGALQLDDLSEEINALNTIVNPPKPAEKPADRALDAIGEVDEEGPKAEVPKSTIARLDKNDRPDMKPLPTGEIKISKKAEDVAPVVSPAKSSSVVVDPKITANIANIALKQIEGVLKEIQYQGKLIFDIEIFSGIPGTEKENEPQHKRGDVTAVKVRFPIEPQAKIVPNDRFKNGEALLNYLNAQVNKINFGNVNNMLPKEDEGLFTKTTAKGTDKEERFSLRTADLKHEMVVDYEKSAPSAGSAPDDARAAASKQARQAESAQFIDIAGKLLLKVDAETKRSLALNLSLLKNSIDSGNEYERNLTDIKLQITYVNLGLLIDFTGINYLSGTIDFLEGSIDWTKSDLLGVKGWIKSSKEMTTNIQWLLGLKNDGASAVARELFNYIKDKLRNGLAEKSTKYIESQEPQNEMADYLVQMKMIKAAVGGNLEEKMWNASKSSGFPKTHLIKTVEQRLGIMRKEMEAKDEKEKIERENAEKFRGLKDKRTALLQKYDAAISIDKGNQTLVYQRDNLQGTTDEGVMRDAGLDIDRWANRQKKYPKLLYKLLTDPKTETKNYNDFGRKLQSFADKNKFFVTGKLSTTLRIDRDGNVVVEKINSIDKRNGIWIVLEDEGKGDKVNIDNDTRMKIFIAFIQSLKFTDRAYLSKKLSISVNIGMGDAGNLDIRGNSSLSE